MLANSMLIPRNSLERKVWFHDDLKYMSYVTAALNRLLAISKRF